MVESTTKSPTGAQLSFFRRKPKAAPASSAAPAPSADVAIAEHGSVITGDYVIDEYGFDAEVTERFLIAALRPIAEKWFRIEVRGAENIPADGGALVVSNHSGTVPLDGLMTAVSIRDHTGRFLRPLGADLVFRLPLIGDLARKGGATLACNEDAERMLRDGELVGVWPNGSQRTMSKKLCRRILKKRGEKIAALKEEVRATRREAQEKQERDWTTILGLDEVIEAQKNELRWLRAEVASLKGESVENPIIVE